ncbi:hypothetical protein SDC9_176413 [bioreactor metagenome]|uniref:Uncharacterized protein n=1 Tax=bioreactor metagenome TaxID=1076179 RepID=A0A645GRW9_9ZZZZ
MVAVVDDFGGGAFGRRDAGFDRGARAGGGDTAGDDPQRTVGKVLVAVGGILLAGVGEEVEDAAEDQRVAAVGRGG